MAAGYGVALQTIAGGVEGYLAGSESNKKRKQIMDAYGNLPEVPDLQAEYLNGYQKQMAMTPGFLQQDRQLRDQFGEQDIRRASNLYGLGLQQYGKQNMAALKKIDPQFLQGRQQLFDVTSGDLARGSQLTPEMEAQLQQYVRGGQASRGNLLGNANIATEAFTQGNAGEQLKQQRIANMRAFLAGPSPQDKYDNLAGGAQGALGAGTAAASNPGFSYLEGPKDWAGNLMRAEGQQFEYANSQALEQAKAYAGAPAEVNPWLSSFQGGLSALSGSMGGGGFGGGGSQPKNASWSSGYNSMMG